MIPLLVLSSLVGWCVAIACYCMWREAERDNKAIVLELYQLLQDWSHEIRRSRTYAAHIRSIESQLRQEIDGADWWKANTE